METIKMKCGHEMPVPGNMGRGNARIKRLANYADRHCLYCALMSEAKLQNELTDAHGNKRPETIVMESLKKHINKIVWSY
jgi:hypothetical protein